MYLWAAADYVPERAVDNAHFAELTGRPPEWFERRTGILSRRRAGEGENSSTMAVAAVERLARSNPRALEDVDLIVGCSYTPWDTIGTLAHVVQRRFELQKARAMLISSACSSFLDSLEVACAYIDTGRAGKALIVASEHNSLYARDHDPQSGHLWGDGAAAVLVTKEKPSQPALRILDTTASGLGHVGTGPEAVSLAPCAGGLTMPHGKDVFHHACHGMEATARELLARAQRGPRDLRFLVPHQANRRIIDHVAERLELSSSQIASTLEMLGNTGCASAPLTLARHFDRLESGDLVLLVVFGGGYSAGGALLRRE